MSTEPDYEQDYDSACPMCGHSPLHHRSCTNWCDDGFIDEADSDPINWYPGEAEHPCPECRGTGTEVWCPNCAENLSGHSPDETDEDLPY